MVVKVAAAGFQWPQPILPHTPSSSQALASALSSPSSSSKRRNRGYGVPLVCRHVQRFHRSALFGTHTTRLRRSWSCEFPKTKLKTIRRATSASLDAFSDEEFSKKIQELSLRFQLSDDGDYDSESAPVSDSRDSNSNSTANRGTSDSSNSYIEESLRLHASVDSVEDRDLFAELPDWTAEEEIITASIERKANSVDLPLSLRMIKRKMQWQDSFREAGESAYCSMKKAFSSMVFIIRELHSFTLQMRELLFYEDLQGILSRVQKEMHASFVWLFQQVFSHTPTLMVYVMILLANFTVYSMGHNTAIAAPSPPGSYSTETATVVEVQDHINHKFDSSAIKTFSASSSGGKTTSIGGNNGGGGKVRPVASGTDGDDGFNRSDQYRGVLPDGASQLSSFETAETASEEVALWDSMLDEASKMQDLFRDEALDRETIQKFVSPVNAKIESDDYEEYLRTDLLYQTSLSEDPNNPLLLANYAQFLHLVVHDNDRAEEYYKRATSVEPTDAEAYNKYATFLWRIRNDLWAAEEAFLEAISADPENSHYAADYANFLWNTGGEDTCFPLNSP